MSKALPLWRSREAGGCALSIETTSFCNGTCPECPRNSDPRRTRWNPDGSPIKEVMPSHHVYRMIREAADMGWNEAIHFIAYNEPMLDNRIYDFAEYATDYGMTPELFTNGTMLTQENIDRVDGLFPYVVLSFRTPGSTAYWQSRFKHSTVRTTNRYGVLIWGTDNELREQSIASVIDEPCVNPPFTAFRVAYDGQMMMCYADLWNSFGLLNAFEHSMEELWFGEEHVEAVKALAVPGSRRHNELCRVCPRVFPDGGEFVTVNKPDTPSDEWLNSVGNWEMLT